MSRQPRPPYRAFPAGMTEPDDTGEGASGVEDSFRGTTAFAPGRMFSRPPHLQTGTSAYAFAATPDAVPALPPHQTGWQPARMSPKVGYSRVASFEGTPQAGPSTLFNAAPPRTERQQAVARPPALNMGPPMPVFATAPSAGGSNLFARPPPMPTMTGFASPPEASLSTSFSFAPRGPASSMFALPTIRPPVQLAPSHALVRPARPIAANTAAPPPAFFNPIAATPPNATTNLDAAALAAERRIREARANPRPADPVPRQPSVSFSPIISTPQHGSYNALPPPPPNRAAAGAAAPSRTHSTALGVDSSIPHLNRAPRLVSTSHNVSLSTDSAFTRPTATRLFPTAPSAPSQPLFPSTSSTSHTAEQSVSWTADEPSVTSHVPPPVRLRKWDGTQTLVPAYLVSDSAEQAVEEECFDADVLRFRPADLLAIHASKVLGQPSTPPADEGVDAVKGILEIQLGLRGLHGWYGHSYRNPRARRSSPPPAGEEGDGSRSRKRRRTSSPESTPNCSTEIADEDEPIIVYDSFGRIRGHISLPNYAHHGGPAFPLPEPRQTFALRHAVAAQLVLTSGTSLADKETRLVREEEVLKERWAELSSNRATDEGQTIRSTRFHTELKDKHQALETFRSTHRKALLKGLQNALLDSTLVAPPRPIVARQ
ncbi:hypothetical protein PSEUBRA_005329 [Kalmanozyma brasiliensis GHG001]|uniref:uncharacterized protein n=1 Tax=Kalmanozyma brasiliensis (strain GHG001) TaxID=1365824 RepID=UPI002867EF7C|nr:uncharacterized protein PSEUBRA_005329 [Kalmanozyma brasiliensis GHG001]KAF6767506.1 hypothetical protein PSEUBRA_005329 [Kalmanozyma brasiliensis GHG001]